MGEETFSGLIEPALSSIVDGERAFSAAHYDADAWAELAQSALIGGILGALGGGVQLVKDAAGSIQTDVPVQEKPEAAEKYETAASDAETAESTEQGSNKQYSMRSEGEERSIRAFNEKYSAKTPHELLPECEYAVIPDVKIINYTLNPNHSRGKDKAVVFERVLGYTQNNAADLIEQVRRGLSIYLATERRTTKYGRVFTVRMLIKGANGRIAPVVTGWQIDNGKTSPRLVSMYVVHWEE